MQIETNGILVNLRAFSERDCVAHIFTRDNGILVGMLRGAVVAKKNKPLVGQVGHLSWNARLDSQLGVFHFENEKNLSAPLMLNANLLKIMNAVFSLIVALVPERESYEHLYQKTFDLLSNLPTAEKPYDLYLNWEMDLLRVLMCCSVSTKIANVVGRLLAAGPECPRFFPMASPPMRLVLVSSVSSEITPQRNSSPITNRVRLSAIFAR